MPRSKPEIIKDENKIYQSLTSRINDQLEKYEESISSLQIPSKHQQSRYEEDVHREHYEKVIAKLRKNDSNLYFGYMDLEEIGHIRVGKLGLNNEHGEKILTDWRAPVASRFYQASPLEPKGVLLRRNITLKSNTIVDFADEMLIKHRNSEYFPSDDSLLLSELDKIKDGPMKDVVSTIQLEQDEIIRYQGSPTVIVQGSAGTGKTVVALHRAAFILYQLREKVERNSALIIGPNNKFLEYIGDVLPSLGEDSATLRTVETLYSQATVSYADSDDSSRLKQSLKMKNLIDAYLDSILPHKHFVFEYNGKIFKVKKEKIFSLVKSSLDDQEGLNTSRTVFIKALYEHILDLLLNDELKEESDNEDNTQLLQDINEELRDDDNFRKNINLLWMPTTPEILYSKMLTSQFLKSTNLLSEGEKKLLLDSTKPLLGKYSLGDTLVLDYILSLLGAPEVKWLPYTRSFNETKSIIRFLYTPTYEYESLYCENYAHIIVDEAQELSYMAWLAIKRRSSNNSLTIVGDIYQRSASWGVDNWNDLQPIFPKIVIKELTINYRNTSEMIDNTLSYLEAIGLHLPPIKPVRSKIDSLSLYNTQDLGKYKNYIIISDEAIPGYDILLPSQVKGREYANVVVVNPENILKNWSWQDLYVSLTRATHHLVVINMIDQ